MHTIPLLLMMLLVNFSVVSAQTTRMKYRVNFDVDKAELDLADKQVLDKIITDYHTSPYGELQLTAHTDADADDAYNLQLSRKRAEAVTAYFTAHGLKANRISVKWFGERKPSTSNADTEGKAVNRRVDITLNQYNIHNSGELIKAASPEYKQTYTIDPTKDNTITGTNGTSVAIPKNALQTKSGKPVTATKVQIVLEEFLTPKDAAFNQLSTVSDGRMLESGGMFSIKAFAENEEVVLKKGKQLQVEMPTINMQKGMELFEAVPTANGVTEWKPLSVPFVPKETKPAPVIFTKLDTAYLRSLIVSQPAFDVEHMELIYDVPELPKAPKELKPLPEFVAPTYQSTFEWYERWFVPGFILDKKLRKEYARQEELYAGQRAKYNKRLARYEVAYRQYVQDSTQFEQSTLSAMQNWLRAQQPIYAAYVRYLETKQWNSAIGELIYKSDNNQLTAKNPQDLFVRYFERVGKTNIERDKFIQAVYRIDFLLTQSMTHIVKDYAKAGMLIPAESNPSFYSSFSFKNTFFEQQLADNPKLIKELNDARQDIAQQRKQAGLADKDIPLISTSYTTTLTAFGSFNCDRFRNIPPAQMATITIPYEGEAKVSFFVAGTNSYMYAAKTESGYTSTLPKGLPIKIVFVVYHPTDGPQLCIQQTALSGNTTMPLETKSISLAELQKELASL